MIDMDNNNIICLPDIDPVIHVANYHTCHKNDSWGPRQNKDLQFILVIKGSIEYITETETLSVKKGNVLSVLPGIKHTINYTGNKEGLISGVHCELSREGTWLNGDYRTDPSPAKINVPESFEDMHQLFKINSKIFNSYHKFRGTQLSSVTKSIILTLGESWEGTSTAIISRRTREMIQFIRDNINKQINRQDLANAFFVTPEHINLIFKKEIGVSPTQLINREKCLFAYKLLQGGDSVKEAAYKAGFNDPLYFSRVFHKTLAIAPRDVR